MMAIEATLSRLCEQIGTLIQEGEAIPTGRFDYGGSQPELGIADEAAFYKWQAEFAILLNELIPRGHPLEVKYQQYAKHGSNVGSLQEMLSLLRGVKSGYEKGLFNRVPLMIRADLAADYLEQAEMLMEKGYHVPSAVLAGAVLEDALRKLCGENNVPTESDNGKRKTIEPMVNDLARKQVFNTAKAQEIKGWAALRNNAAHGDGDKNDPGAVERMIEGVRSFVGDYLR